MEAAGGFNAACFWEREMSRPSKLATLLGSCSVNDLEKLVQAKKLGAQRDVLCERAVELTTELRSVNRQIRRTERSIRKALKAGKRGPGRPRAVKVKVKAKGSKVRKSRRGGRKGVLLGLRPSSLAHKVHEFIKGSPGKQARVSDIATALKGWKGKSEDQLMRHVGATLSKRNAYFKKVDRGLYTLAAN